MQAPRRKSAIIMAMHILKAAERKMDIELTPYQSLKFLSLNLEFLNRWWFWNFFELDRIMWRGTKRTAAKIPTLKKLLRMLKFLQIFTSTFTSLIY